MARGTQLGQLVTQFRAEARQSTQLSVGTDSLEHVKQLIRRTQEMEYVDPANDWAFLRVYVAIPLSAGQRYYDAPALLNIDRVEEVNVIDGGPPIPVGRGISFPEYAVFDSDSDVRSSRALKWDLRWTGTATQIEVWPVPSDNTQKLWFRCLRPLRPLIEMSDVADLDDILITLKAAAEELAAQKAKDAELKLQMAQQHKAALKANARAGSQDISMVPGRPSNFPLHPTIRVT